MINSALKSIKFLTVSHARKTDILFSTLNKNAFLKTLLDDLQTYGFTIEYPLITTRGEYHVRTLKVAHKDDKIESKDILHDRILFRLPLRLGLALNMHCFLHELIHFYQDMMGLFYIPIEYMNGFSISLDPQSSVGAALFCEAMAQVEAIRISWDLKEKGYPLAWNGAQKSLDWRVLSRMYSNAIAIHNTEEEAAVEIFKAWYDTPQRLAYEWQAIKRYQNNLQKKIALTPHLNNTEISTQFRSLTTQNIFDHIQDEKQFAYIKTLNLNDKIFNDVQHQKAQAYILQFEEKFKAPNNDNLNNFIIGSPVYVWAQNFKD